MKHKIFKRILLLLLLVLAVIICFPVVFLIVGSLMGTDELNHYLGAVLGKADGFASWALLPTYPTFKAYVQLLLDSPEFFVMFWNSVKMTGAILLGQIVTGVPAAWGFARLDIPGKKVLFNLYIILMLMPFQVTMLSNYLTLDHSRTRKHPFHNPHLHSTASFDPYRTYLYLIKFRKPHYKWS